VKQKELLKYGQDILKQNEIEDAKIKAKLLLNYILNQTSDQFFINDEKEVEEEKYLKYNEGIKLIIQGKPLQYIVNKQEFMGHKFYVDENVLIPQPDTEVLVETAIRLIVKGIKDISDDKKTKQQINILDLCTGSGNIAISLAKYVENAKIIATDISEKALDVAIKNAKINNVYNKIEFIKSDLFEKLEEMEFDYIISNPPYIKSEEILKLSKEVQNEPKIALDGGKDGLEFYRKIFKKAPEFLKDKGYLILEIGFDQAQQIIEIYNKEEFSQVGNIIKDYGGNDRVVIFRKK